MGIAWKKDSELKYGKIPELEKKISKMQNLGLKNEDIKVWLDSYHELEKAKEFQKYQEILLNIQEKINALKAKIGIMD